MPTSFGIDEVGSAEGFLAVVFDCGTGCEFGCEFIAAGMR